MQQSHNVVPYIGTWIETQFSATPKRKTKVVPYIGTWIETHQNETSAVIWIVVPYIGTWIETSMQQAVYFAITRRTLYRYVD